MPEISGERGVGGRQESYEVVLGRTYGPFGWVSPVIIGGGTIDSRQYGRLRGREARPSLRYLRLG